MTTTDDTLLEKVRDTASKAMKTLDHCVARCGEMLAAEGKYDDKTASHLAYLTKHIAQILEVLRKLEKHDQDAVKRMSQEERDRLVGEYVRDLPKKRRAEFRAMLDALDGNV